MGQTRVLWTIMALETDTVSEDRRAFDTRSLETVMDSEDRHKLCRQTVKDF